MKIRKMIKNMIIAPVLMPVLAILSCGSEEEFEDGNKPELKDEITTFKRYDINVDSQGNINVAVGKNVEINYQELADIFKKGSGKITIEGLEKYDNNVPDTYTFKIKDPGVGKNAKEKTIDFKIKVDDKLPGIAVDGITPILKMNNLLMKNKKITKKNNDFFVSLPASGDWPSIEEIKGLFKKPKNHNLVIYIPFDYDEINKIPGYFNFKINDPGKGQRPIEKSINLIIEMK